MPKNASDSQPNVSIRDNRRDPISRSPDGHSLMQLFHCISHSCRGTLARINQRPQYALDQRQVNGADNHAATIRAGIVDYLGPRTPNRNWHEALQCHEAPQPRVQEPRNDDWAPAVLAVRSKAEQRLQQKRVQPTNTEQNPIPEPRRKNDRNQTGRGAEVDV